MSCDGMALVYRATACSSLDWTSAQGWVELLIEACWNQNTRDVNRVTHVYQVKRDRDKLILALQTSFPTLILQQGLLVQIHAIEGLASF